MASIAILGLGAIGQYIAAKFSSQPDSKLYLLARSNYILIKEEGIMVSEASPPSEWIISNNRFSITNTIDHIPECDYVIICVKSNQTSNLVDHIKLICHKETKIITLQNGLNFEEDIKQALPENLSLYSGTCWIKISAISPNHIRHDFGDLIKLGGYHQQHTIKPITEKDYMIQAIFAQAGITIELSDNIHSIQLTKLALNIPLFIAAVKAKKNVSEMLADKKSDQLRDTLQKEIIAAAASTGSPVDVDYINLVLADLRKIQDISVASKMELLKRMKEELPQSAGNLLDFFNARGVDLPQLKLHYSSILTSAYDNV